MKWTRMQRLRIQQLERDILMHDGMGKDYVHNYEYKKFEVVEDHGNLFLVSVVGRKRDEGTWNELFNRTMRHILIGRKGGLRLLNAKDHRRKGKASSYARRGPTGYSAVLYSVTV